MNPTMNTTTRLFIALVAFALPFGTRSSAADAPIKHRLLLTEYGKGPNRFVELDLPIEQVVKVIKQMPNPDYPKTTPKGGTGKGIWIR